MTGLLSCGACGAPMYAQRSQNKKGDYVYYSCRERQRHGVTCCDSPRVREDQVMDLITQQLSWIFDGTDEM